MTQAKLFYARDIMFHQNLLVGYYCGGGFNEISVHRLYGGSVQRLAMD